LIFEEKPTINQLITGTPKLTCIFWLKSLISTNENCFVGDIVFEWNTMENEILKWKNLFKFYPKRLFWLEKSLK
jgi:hypothetical protein